MGGSHLTGRKDKIVQVLLGLTPLFLLDATSWMVGYRGDLQKETLTTRRPLAEPHTRTPLPSWL